VKPSFNWGKSKGIRRIYISLIFPVGRFPNTKTWKKHSFTFMNRNTTQKELHINWLYLFRLHQKLQLYFMP
jgi:hypothetical protein